MSHSMTHTVVIELPDSRPANSRKGIHPGGINGLNDQFLTGELTSGSSA